MSFCELFCASLFNKVRLCEECEGWFLEHKVNKNSGFCEKCHKDSGWNGSLIFDHPNKRLRASTETLTKDTQNGLTKQYTKKKCQKESQES